MSRFVAFLIGLSAGISLGVLYVLTTDELIDWVGPR